jgi:hypothetical protein
MFFADAVTTTPFGMLYVLGAVVNHLTIVLHHGGFGLGLIALTNTFD